MIINRKYNIRIFGFLFSGKKRCIKTNKSHHYEHDSMHHYKRKYSRLFMTRNRINNGSRQKHQIYQNFIKILFYETFENEFFSIDYLRIFGSTVYVFIHEKKIGHISKSVKFSPKTQKNMLVGYDEKTIYKIFFEKNHKIVKIKDLRIFENSNHKDGTEIFTYDVIMTEIFF